MDTAELDDFIGLVQVAAAGNATFTPLAATITALGTWPAAFDTKRSPSTPIGTPAQVTGFEAKAAEPGAIDLSGNTVHGAVAYIYECSMYDTPRSWTQIKMGTNARFTATGLTSGTIYAFRMRAMGSAGEGPWSDEAVMRAP